MSKKKKVIYSTLLIMAILLIAVGFIGKNIWDKIYSPNITAKESETYIYIPTNSSYEDVISIITKMGIVNDIESFEYVAKLKKYKNKIHAGRYEVSDGMSNNSLINNLRSGNQSPVKVTFISVRSLDILAGKISAYIEADSVQLSTIFNDKQTAEKYGFNSQTFCSMFIPNTYEFRWNTSAEQFVERIAAEYKKFWNDERKQKALKINLSQSEISTLASIVESETQKNDEKSRIAGVYINRLNKGWLLQADPTVVYANGDFGIRRILNKHLEIDSPYNTYKYQGLPPGPICIPSTNSLNAVLNYEKHNYMYFCAKDDFSGYHNFAVTNAQHNANAERYHRALQKLK